MRDPMTDPAARRRMATARYARSHNKAQAARHFGCCWATAQTVVQRVEEYERTGSIRVMQNRPRGKSGPTSQETEDLVGAIYRESLKPKRPQGRRYSAAKVARLLNKRHQIERCRKTAWLILRRRGVWVSPTTQKRVMRRFERAQPKGTTQFKQVMDVLGIGLRIAPRAQTKGKEERLNQFVDRDFLDEC